MNVIGYVAVYKIYSIIFSSTQYCLPLPDGIASRMYVRSIICHCICVFCYLKKVKTLYCITMQYLIEVGATSNVVLLNHAHIQSSNKKSANLYLLHSVEANLIGDH